MKYTTFSQGMESNHLVKHSGQVFTPDSWVKKILDIASYHGDNILRKHLIDNSCGDGAFLCEAVERYCRQHPSALGTGNAGLKEELETYIHGIELDPVAFNNCLYNLGEVAGRFGVHDVNWDVINEDALLVTRHDRKMDFVVGNPPYVRVHNLADSYDAVKCFSFAQDGMTDLYLVFYELGFRMLKPQGTLCYITPSSWLSSVAASNMRKYILLRRTLSRLLDLGHYQAFEGITTYTMITLFTNGKTSDAVDYYRYAPDTGEDVFVDRIPLTEMSIGNYFYIASRKDLAALRKIKEGLHRQLCSVKNGFATLADGVFILGVRFKELTIPVLKASTGQWHIGFYPYDRNGKPLPREEIFSHEEVARYLNDNKNALLKGKSEARHPEWYLYGRTQALKDVGKDKIAVNIVIKDTKSIRLKKVPAGSGLYSGLYILTDVPFETIEGLVRSDEFINYLKILKKYKSGGYYTFNSKDLEEYLNARLTEQDFTYGHKTDERRVSEGHLPFL